MKKKDPLTALGMALAKKMLEEKIDSSGQLFSYKGKRFIVQVRRTKQKSL